MFFTKRRLVLISVIASVVAVIVFIPLIINYISSPNVEAISISLSDIRVTNDINETNSIQLAVVFNFTNLGDKTVTTSHIEYDLFANDEFMGHGVLSYEEIPLNGRPQLYKDISVPLQSSFVVSPTETNKDIIEAITKDPLEIENNFNWRVNGVGQINSAFVISPKQFSSELVN